MVSTTPLSTNILKVIEPLFLDELREEGQPTGPQQVHHRQRIPASVQGLAGRTWCSSTPRAAAATSSSSPTASCGQSRPALSLRCALTRRVEQTASMDVSLDQRMNIGQFHGFELNWWPAKIAETAMFLVDHQANRALAAAVGDAPERLPITHHRPHSPRQRIALGVGVPEIPRTSGATYVFGNPPFIGQYTKTKEQTADMKQAWGTDYDGYLDYVTAWHAKTKDLLVDRVGDFAYVTTNSITQGQPVPALFGPLYREGWDIKFAHRTFAWNSDAPGKAAVHCVIIGFTRNSATKPRLWDYEQQKGEPIEVKVQHGINAYLIDGPRILVKKTMKPLSPVVTPARFGSKPTDGGHLIVEAEDYDAVAADPNAAKYLRPFRMGRELVRGLDRWCLWMAENFDPKDLTRSMVLRHRVSAVKAMRLDSKKKATQDSSATPYLFQENHQPDTNYVGVPAVVSSTRDFYTAISLPPDVIAGNKIYTIDDPTGLQFALLSSSMFITWQKTVGGRLKSDLNFANTLTWNTFPVPELDGKTRTSIIKAGQGILDARALHPDRSLADAYNPLAMDPSLVKAHDKLDREVDKAFGSERKLTTERQRLEILFTRYAEMTAEKS
jgi:hypothetical protein